MPRYCAFDCLAARRGPGIGRSRPIGGGSAGEVAVGAQTRRAIAICVSGVRSLASAGARSLCALTPTSEQADGALQRFGREHRRAEVCRRFAAEHLLPACFCPTKPDSLGKSRQRMAVSLNLNEQCLELSALQLASNEPRCAPPSLQAIRNHHFGLRFRHRIICREGMTFALAQGSAQGYWRPMIFLF